VASERTIQSAYDHCDSALERATRRDRPSTVRRRSTTYETESLSTSACLAALAASTDGVLLINRAGVIVYANPAAESFFSDASLSGQFFSDVSALDRRTLNRIWRELYRARCWRGRLGLRSPGPELEVTVQRVCDDEPAAEKFCVVLHGAARAEFATEAASSSLAESATAASAGAGTGTGKRGARSELQTALQRVASEIAHDFNNQIAVILNYTFVLLRQMPADSPLKAHVSEMQAAAWRASHVAQAIHRALVTHTLLPSGENT
jgi:signal transduction histidine kinase